MFSNRVRKRVLQIFTFGCILIGLQASQSLSDAASKTEEEDTQNIATLWNFARKENFETRLFEKRLRKDGKSADDIEKLYYRLLWGGLAQDESASAYQDDFSPIQIIANNFVYSYRRFREASEQVMRWEADLDDMYGLYYQAKDSVNPAGLSSVELEYTLRRLKRDLSSSRNERKDWFCKLVRFCGDEARPLLVLLTEDPTFAREQNSWVIRH